MIPDNFNQLALKAQFRILVNYFMEKHNKKPCHLYHDTKHHYNFILNSLQNDVDHKFDTADYLAEKLGYKLIFQWVPLSNLKENHEHKEKLHHSSGDLNQ